jgi:hypothetical protein
VNLLLDITKNSRAEAGRGHRWDRTIAAASDQSCAAGVPLRFAWSAAAETF